MAVPTRLSVTTRTNYLNAIWDNIQDNVVAWAMLKRKGNITYNETGSAVEWNAEVGEHKGSARTIGDARSFEDKNHYINPALTPVVRDFTDRITWEEGQMNRGAEARVKLEKTIMKRMGKNMKKDLASQLIIGDGTGGDVSGLASIFSDDGTTIEGGKQYNPNGTYAGYSLALGGLDGIADDVEAGAFAPLIVNALDAEFDIAAGTGTTWASNSTGAIRYAIQKLCYSNDPEFKPDVVILNRNDYIAYLNGNDDKIRLNHEMKVGTDHLGFENVAGDLNTPVVWDEFVPDGVGYVVNFDQIGAHFWHEGAVYLDDDNDIKTNAQLYAAEALWQLRINPRYQGKIITA